MTLNYFPFLDEETNGQNNELMSSKPTVYKQQSADRLSPPFLTSSRTPPGWPPPALCSGLLFLAELLGRTIIGRMSGGKKWCGSGPQVRQSASS